MAQWLEAKVTSRTDWNDHLFSLRFRCSGFTQFKAGQFTKLGIEKNGTMLSRPYSLVNGPNAQELEVLAVPVENGLLSPELHKLQVGDTLNVMSPATGFLVLDEVPKSRDLWLIATGTGVGPFLSILATEQAWINYQNIVLVYAARYESDIAYMDLIDSLSNQYIDKFRFVPIVSREDKTEKLRGHIPTLLKTSCIEQQAGLAIDVRYSQVMLCGNPAMITDTMQVLAELGLTKHLRRSPGQISLERYW